MANWSNFVEIPSVRKLFVVPIAENNHGKSLVIRALVRLAGAETTGWKRLDVALMTLSGQRISALIYPSSLPEMKCREPYKKAAVEFLRALDRQWWTYDLIVLPIHEDPAIADELIALGQRYGFDMIAVTITRNETIVSPPHQECLRRPWNERWTPSKSDAPQISSPAQEAWSSLQTGRGPDQCAGRSSLDPHPTNDVPLSPCDRTFGAGRRLSQSKITPHKSAYRQRPPNEESGFLEK